MSININSEAFCRKAYLNFHCYGNTMNISSEDMGEITQAWKGKIQSWQDTVASDENEYEFDDSEYTNYKSEGKEAGQDDTSGSHGNKGGTIAEGVGDAVFNLGGTVVSYLGTKVTQKVAEKAVEKSVQKAVQKAVENAGVACGEALVQEVSKKAVEEGVKNIATKVLGEKATSKIAEESAKKVAEESAEKIAEETAKETTKEIAKTFSAYVAAAFAIANASKYWATQPNKQEKNAVDALQTEMQGAQATLGEAQGEMEAMSEEIIDLSDEANTINEETNEEIKDQKTEYDMYMQTFLAIQEKVQNGEDLTDSEKALYKSVMGYMTEISTKIQENSENTTLEVADLYDEIGTYQEGYDVAAETMGEIQGLTDYAEGFDSATQIMCYVEAGAQTLNVATATKAAARLFAGPFWNWAIAALASAAGISSGVAATQQFQWAGEVGTEVDMRKATQDLNTETMDFYDEEIDAYDGFMQGVEDLELEVPDEITPPENAELPSISNTGAEENVAIETLKPKKELTEKTKM